MEITGDTLDVLLDALSEQLRSLGVQLEIVVIGGSALTALGLVKRATRDVDLVAIAENGELHSAEPLPDALRTARDRVARDFELDENWLNPGPTELLKSGLPAGFLHPTAEELVAAARWSLTQDPSPGYRMVLLEALSTLGVEDADLGA